MINYALVIRHFTLFYSVHIAVNVLKIQWQMPRSVFLLVGLINFVSVLIVYHEKFFKIGLLILFIYKFWTCYLRFPATGNHQYVELLILLFLLVFSHRPEKEEKDPFSLKLVSLIQYTLLSIYFFSGIQKICQGQWLSGEFLSKCLFGNTNLALSMTLRPILRNLQNLLHSPLPPLPIPSAKTMEVVMFSIPEWTKWVFKGMSWTIILAEILTPILVFVPKTRRHGLVLLLFTQMLIGVASWELEFMFGALGCVLLYDPAHSRRNYCLLTAVQILYSLGIYLSGGQLWNY